MKRTMFAPDDPRSIPRHLASMEPPPTRELVLQQKVQFEKKMNCTMQHYLSRPVIIPVHSHLPWKHTVQAAVLQALEQYHTDKIF